MTKGIFENEERAQVLCALDRWSGKLAGAALLSIVLINGAAIGFRYVLEAPLSWSEEVMRYANIWLTFLGAVSAFVREEHMAVSPPWPDWIWRPLRVLHLVLAIGLAAAMVWLGWHGAMDNLSQRSPSAGIVMAIPYAAVPVAGCLLFVAALARIAALVMASEAQEGG